MTRYITIETSLDIVRALAVGPVRDVGLLISAIERPAATLFGVDAYPSLSAKAAVLLESLVRNHPLVDGNKRFGWTATVVFVALNGVRLEMPDDEAFDLVVDAAAGRLTADIIAARLEECLQVGTWT